MRPDTSRGMTSPCWAWNFREGRKDRISNPLTTISGADMNRTEQTNMETKPQNTPAKAELPKILVIDDELGIRELLLFCLQPLGYRVITASNGEEGLRVARQ